MRVIKVADDLGEVESVDVALVSVRPNQGSNLVAVTQQSPCQVRADEAVAPVTNASIGVWIRNERLCAPARLP